MSESTAPTRAFVIGPPELAERIAAQFRDLGMVTETVKTPANEGDLRTWLASKASSDPTYIHPGLSFWADRPEFPQMVSSHGFFPVTPSPRALSLSLNKLNVMIEAEAAGIPHLAIGLDPLMSLREIEALLDRTGERFPIVLKSLKVAQGHGIQVVSSLAQLREIVPVWFEQLTRRYGEASVIVERCPPSARHLIVPFAADGARFSKIFPTIDASLQTRWRRMIQFIPATGLGKDIEALLEGYVEKWVQHLSFSGLGSLEFLVDGPRVFLIDASARLPAAFPLWEILGGVRSIEWQLAALGQIPVPVNNAKVPEYGAGISLRFYAEDPIRQIPCPGFIRELTEPFVEKTSDTETIWMNRYASGRAVPWTSTGVIGELFVFGKDRKTVISSARESLRKIWIAGSIQTNRRFLIEHLEHPFVRENLIHAGFTDEDFTPIGFPDREVVVELVSLASSFFPGKGDRWIADSQWVEPDPSRISNLRRRDEFKVSGSFEGAGVSGETADGTRFLFEPTKPDRWLVHFGIWTLSLRRVPLGESESSEASRTAPRSKMRKILALAPGRIHALLRHPGEVLGPRDRACMLESIGILVPHAVPVSVRLIEWKVVPGQVVEAGHELAVLELLS